MIPGSILANCEPHDTVLHIGPGVLYDDISYEAVSANIIIAEPDLDRAAALAGLAARRKTKLIRKGVLAGPGAATLHRYSFPMLNSFRESPELKRLFPGLIEIEALPIESLSVAELLGMLPPEHDGNDILIIDALGEAFDLLQSLHKASALSRFSVIILRTTRDDLYSRGAHAAAVSDWLKERYFDRPLRRDDDPDFPVLCFFRNRLAENISGMLAEAAATEQALRADLESSRGEAKRAEDARKEAVEATERALRADLESSRDEAKRAEDARKEAVEANARLAHEARLAGMVRLAAQSDMLDLQERYQALHREKKEQDDLLRKVTQKLIEVSESIPNPATASRKQAADENSVDARTPLRSDKKGTS